MSRLSTRIHPLLTESIIDNLFAMRIFTVSTFIETDVKYLINVTNLTYKDVLTVRKHIVNKNAAVTRNGLEAFREWMTKNALLQTGIINIDSMLNGGLLTGHIYELCGLPASGKTQFCLTIAQSIVRQLRQPIYYLDCKGDFNAVRVKLMLNAAKIKNKETAEIMSKILVKRIITLYELINALYRIKDEIRDGLNVKMIIIDSMPAVLYRFEDFPQCHSALNHLVNVMKFLACECYTCLVVTNTLTTWYEGNIGEENLYSEKIGSGKYWQSIPNTRLMFSKGEDGEKCEVSVVKSKEISTKNTTTIVQITDLGIV